MQSEAIQKYQVSKRFRLSIHWATSAKEQASASSQGRRASPGSAEQEGDRDGPAEKKSKHPGPLGGRGAADGEGIRAAAFGPAPFHPAVEGE